MAALRLACVTLMLAMAVPSAAQPTVRWRNLIYEASNRCGVPVAWIERVMRAESNGDTMLGGGPIRSRAGAMGLMQLMPGTWDEMRRSLGLGSDPDYPADNIMAGSCYLRRMYDRFGYPGLFAAYNAGPARYAAHLATGRKLPGETIAYLGKVTGSAVSAPVSPSNPAREGLFAIRRQVSVTTRDVTAEPLQSSLFVVRNHVP
ncbi:lytic transglycosylase domain-containing protein [Sphingobium sp. MI1205]|uniref:lytic transglycosylase domain-containing protein n=1 Tax=Sphingobium sp. MI1205 TaxID=407020 RepID=UPI00077020DB|nr:lytic transglycosylase catalytic [Sphingobium sp. MI1205]